MLGSLAFCVFVLPDFNFFDSSDSEDRKLESVLLGIVVMCVMSAICLTFGNLYYRTIEEDAWLAESRKKIDDSLESMSSSIKKISEV